MIKSRHIYCESFLLFVLLFVTQRLVTFQDLRPADLVNTKAMLKVFFVGFLSDLWIAQLLALLLALCTHILLRLQRGSWIRPLQALVFSSSVIGLAGHQAYVRFFKFSLIPFHVLYLGDSSFLLANGRSILGGPLLAHGLALSLGYLLLRWFFRLEQRSSRQLWLASTALFFGTMLAHNRNIEWRVQWFVPDSLQTHFLERLFKLYGDKTTVAPLSPGERESFETQFSQRLDFEDAQLHPIAPFIKKAWQEALTQKQKPIFIVLLMESMRPSESGYFAQAAQHRDLKGSLTPGLDQLAEHSVVFRQAYSTGSVTRGGQEAVFCGSLSSRDTSMMRGEAVHAFPCIPDHIAQSEHGPWRGESFWYHGGHPGFDNQLSFWKSRHVFDTLTMDDFGSEVPRTDWGIGDISFLSRVSSRLKSYREQSSADFLVGMVLSVSHHIPWGLPADSHDSLGLAVDPGQHPSYRTAAYADHAFSNFLSELKTSGLWDRSLLILVSDHGNSLPPYHDLYGKDPFADLRLQSHVQLVMTGGIIDRSLEQQKFQKLWVDTAVSQADVPAFFAYLNDWQNFSGVGENPFVRMRNRPVLSQLEGALFAPQVPDRFGPQDFMKAGEGPYLSDRAKALLFYRAYLESIHDVKPASQ